MISAHLIQRGAKLRMPSTITGVKGNAKPMRVKMAARKPSLWKKVASVKQFMVQKSALESATAIMENSSAKHVFILITRNYS